MNRFFRLWRLGGRDLRLLWFALKHPDRPLWLWPAALLLVFYALEPLNIAIPFVGLVDELLILPLALHWLLKLLPAAVRGDFAYKLTGQSSFS